MLTYISSIFGQNKFDFKDYLCVHHIKRHFASMFENKITKIRYMTTRLFFGNLTIVICRHLDVFVMFLKYFRYCQYLMILKLLISKRNHDDDVDGDDDDDDIH